MSTPQQRCQLSAFSRRLIPIKSKKALAPQTSQRRAILIRPGDRVLLLAIVITVSYLLTACGGLAHEQKTAANDAVRALRKIEAGTQVGISYQQYGLMVIEAKALINEASNKLPDGELKSELIATMDAYAEAGAAWGATISDELYPGSKLANDLKAHYNIQVEQTYLESDKKQQRSMILSTIWETARKRLEKTSALLEK